MNIKTVITNIKIKHALFLAFAFAMTATLSFLAIHNMAKTDAASFQAGDIMSDAVMANYNSMSESDINNFMHSKNSCNDTDLSKRNRYPNLTYQIKDGHFVCLADQTFNGQSAAHIIWQAAQDYHINPQVLLVLLQKEQSLITDTWPDDQQIRKATGYACTDSAPCDPTKSGFENQIRKAADLYRTVLDGGWTNYPVGNNYVKYHPQDVCGGSTVYIANRATSALYRYTPYQPGGTGTYTGSDGKQYSCYSYGNENFFKYFTNWFGDTHAIKDYKNVYLPEGTYNISTTSGKNLSFTSGDSGQAAQLSSSDSSAYQKFQFILDGDYYKIKNIDTGLFLDLYNASINDGAKLQLWSENDTCAQQWRISITDDSSYRIISGCSLGYSVDVSGAAISSSGVKVQLWNNNNTGAQKWVLKNLNNTPVNEGTYAITTISNKALALVNETTSNNTKLVTGDVHSAQTEQFQFIRRDDGYYRIKNVAAKRSLDVEDMRTSDGTNIQIYDDNSTCAQRWVIKHSSSGYNFISACSGKALDVYDAKISQNNTKIQIWTTNNSDAQNWKLTTPMGQLIENGTYSITTNINSQFSLDSDSSFAPRDGTKIHLWNTNDSYAQKFQIKYNSDGYYTIKSIFSNRNLDVNGASRKAGTNIHNWTANSTCAQKWMIIPIGDSYQILSACSRLALDVKNGTAKADAKVQIWDNNYSNAQQWKFHAVDPQILSSGEYVIETATHKNKVVDVNQGLARDGTNIQLWDKNNTDSQKFILSYDQDNNTYIFTSKIANRPLDVDNARMSDGTNIKIWSKNNSCAQSWILSPLGNDYFNLISSCGDKVMDVSNADTFNGANIQVWHNNNTNAQKWKFIKTS